MSSLSNLFNVSKVSNLPTVLQSNRQSNSHTVEHKVTAQVMRECVVNADVHPGFLAEAIVAAHDMEVEAEDWERPSCFAWPRVIPAMSADDWKTLSDSGLTHPSKIAEITDMKDWIAAFLAPLASRLVKSHDLAVTRCLGPAGGETRLSFIFCILAGTKSSWTLPKVLGSGPLPRIFLRTQEVGVFKVDAEVWPFEGLGGFVSAYRHPLTLMILHQGLVQEQGTKLIDALTALALPRLLTEFDSSDVEKKQVVSGVHLSVGQSVWVPFGCVVIPMAVSEDRPSLIEKDLSAEEAAAMRKKQFRPCFQVVQLCLDTCPS